MDFDTEQEDTATAVLDPMDEDREGAELIDGEWVEKAMSADTSQVNGNVYAVVHAYNRRTRFGNALDAEGAYRLFPDQKKIVRKPDASLIARDKLPGGKLPRGTIVGPPDFAAEVVSPTDLADDLNRKVDEYLRAGVRLVWVVYVPTRTVWVYTAAGTATRKTAADRLDGGDVLPGLDVPVAELFDGV